MASLSLAGGTKRISEQPSFSLSVFSHCSCWCLNKFSCCCREMAGQGLSRTAQGMSQGLCLQLKRIIFQALSQEGRMGSRGLVQPLRKKKQRQINTSQEELPDCAQRQTWRDLCQECLEWDRLMTDSSILPLQQALAKSRRGGFISAPGVSTYQWRFHVSVLSLHFHASAIHRD